MRLLGVLLLLWVSAAASAAQAPQFSGDWVNGGPYSLAALKGKSIVLYFYEAG